jgi:cell division septal protein FtsQ
MSIQPSVDQLIHERKLKHRKQVQHRWLMRGLVSLWIIGLGVLGSAYVLNAPSKLQRVIWVGENLLSPAELRQVAQLSNPEWMVLLDPVIVKSRLEEHPLIAKVSITRQSANTWWVSIQERRLIGLLLDSEGHHYVTEDGSLVPVTPALIARNLSLPLIFDVINAEDLVQLATELAPLNDEIFVNISEIHISHLAFDQPVLVVHMQDGNRVYVAISALFRLTDYYRVVQNSGITNACFELIETGDAVPVITCPSD